MVIYLHWLYKTIFWRFVCHSEIVLKGSGMRMIWGRLRWRSTGVVYTHTTHTSVGSRLRAAHYTRAYNGTFLRRKTFVRLVVTVSPLFVLRPYEVCRYAAAASFTRRRIARGAVHTYVRHHGHRDVAAYGRACENWIVIVGRLLYGRLETRNATAWGKER